MNMFTPVEVMQNYSSLGKAKAEYPAGKLLISAITAGLFVAFGAAVSNTATHGIFNISAARIISGLLFPFGLGMVMLLGAELFTGNCLISISVLNKETTVRKMLRNWFFVYFGNGIGAVLIAAGCVFFGQLNYSNGELALYTIRMAVSKCAVSFPQGMVMGIFCNLLVCAGVLCALSAKDTIGRIAGAFIPVSFFVICGFEHSIANFYYIPAGLFAMQSHDYAALAAAAGINTDTLTWVNLFLRNLLPVTLGNIIGGVMIGLAVWKINQPNCFRSTK
jgi:formate/nitrite transporter